MRVVNNSLARNNQHNPEGSLAQAQTHFYNRNLRIMLLTIEFCKAIVTGIVKVEIEVAVKVAMNRSRTFVP